MIRSRRILITTLLFFAVGAVPALAQSTHPPVATFSIVAHDPDTGEMGVAVQSRYFSVGHVCRGERPESGWLPPRRT